MYVRSSILPNDHVYSNILPKLSYFTNLNFPEIASDFSERQRPKLRAQVGSWGRGIIWPEYCTVSYTNQPEWNNCGNNVVKHPKLFYKISTPCMYFHIRALYMSYMYICVSIYIYIYVYIYIYIRHCILSKRKNRSHGEQHTQKQKKLQDPFQTPFEPSKLINFHQSIWLKQFLQVFFSRLL